MPLYTVKKRIIERGKYDKEETMNKLDVFLATDRLTTDQYKELVEMMK